MVTLVLHQGSIKEPKTYWDKVNVLDLIKILNEIMEDPYILDHKDDDMSRAVDCRYPEMDMLCWEVLIDGAGRPKPFAQKLLEDAGYVLKPGEVDELGWVHGTIYTAKGFYVFG